MSELAQTPEPPYYAVIFTSTKTDNNEGYPEMADRMVELASQQPGFLGVDSARAEIGITVSYWKDSESIQAWRSNLEHQAAQKLGYERWYQSFTLRIARVERAYEFEKP